MMDMLKCHPSSFDEQLSSPIFFSNVDSSSANDRLNIRQNKKRWIGRCLGDPPRQLNALDSLYILQQRLFDRELSRCDPPGTDPTTLPKVKVQQQQQQQKSGNKEPLKVTTVTSYSILSNVDATHGRLSDALSKHFTIKAEPLRPANSFLSNSTNTLSTCQKYWTSTHTRRHRKEAGDSEWPFPGSKSSQSNSTTTNFITFCDLPSRKNTAYNISSRTPLATKDNSTQSPLLFDKQSSFLEEENQPFLPSIVPLEEKTPPMNLPPTENDNAIITNDNTEISTLTTKIYKLPLPSTQTNLPKSILKRRSRSKSSEQKSVVSSTVIEKKQTICTASIPNTSVPKRKNPTSSNRSRRSMTKKQQQSLTAVITTTPRSKYALGRWDEPYIGTRFDPPTPPSSPSLCPWSQDSDHDENETPYQINDIHEVHL